MDSIANPTYGGTSAVVQFDLNGPEAERVVMKTIRRVSLGYGIKLSIPDARVLADVLYEQARKIQDLEMKGRALEKALYPLKRVLPLAEKGRRWWKRGS